MNILVIGASRGIGLELVKQALERGHKVTTLLRDPAKLTLEHPHLCRVRGDAGDPEAVKSAAQGQDAICSCIGVGLTFGPVDIFSRGARNVLDAIEGTPTKFIAITGIGAGESRGHGGFLYDSIFQPLLLGAAYADKDRQEALMRASSANWMILRPGFLTNGPRTGKYRVVTEMTGFTAGWISRADVAHFMLDQLERPTFFGKAPVLTY